MNAQAHLLAQGWAGPGHSLPSSSGSGLSRPLLVAKKQNNLGVGKKKFDLADQWWLRAFDNKLKGISSTTGTNAQTTNGEVEVRVTQTHVGGDLDMVRGGGRKWVGRGGLYGRFVKGEVLGGTFEEQAEKSVKRRRVDTEAKTEDKLAQKQRRNDRKATETALESRIDMQENEDPESEYPNTRELSLNSWPEDTSLSIPENTVQQKAKVESKEERRRRKAERRAHKAGEGKISAIETTNATSPETVDMGKGKVRPEKEQKSKKSHKCKEPNR